MTETDTKGKVAGCCHLSLYESLMDIHIHVSKGSKQLSIVFRDKSLSRLKGKRMKIQKYGKVTTRIHLFGRREANVYLLKGNNSYAIVGGGMVHIVPEMIEQLRKASVEEEKIHYIFILHTHFDHCGAVPYFKRRWPWAKVVSSERGKELLGNPKVIQTCELMNHALLEKYEYQEEAEDLNLGECKISVDETVSDGDILTLDNLTIEVLETPGHSSCSISLYVPEERALFASDAGGIPFGEKVFTAANSNFDQYMKSLKKMNRLGVDVYLAEHYGARTGDDAREFMRNSLVSAEETRKYLESALEEHDFDMDKAEKKVLDWLVAEAPYDFLPKEIIEIVVRQMLTYVSRHPGNE